MNRIEFDAFQRPEQGKARHSRAEQLQAALGRHSFKTSKPKQSSSPAFRSGPTIQLVGKRVLLCPTCRVCRVKGRVKGIANVPNSLVTKAEQSRTEQSGQARKLWSPAPKLLSSVPELWSATPKLLSSISNLGVSFSQRESVNYATQRQNFKGEPGNCQALEKSCDA